MRGAARISQLMRVVYFGSPEIARRVLSKLMEGGVEVVGVVTQPPRSQGRSGSPRSTAVAEAVSTTHPDIPLIEAEQASSDEVVEQLERLNADLFVVFAFGQFLGKRLRETPRLACINLHPSLLPKYRGAAPIQWALINGDAETGVTIMTVVREMDGGDIIRQAATAVGREESLPHLEERLCDLGATLLLQTIADYERGEVVYTPQDPKGVVMAPKLNPEDGELKWDQSALSLYNRFRGVTPKPGAWCTVWIRGHERRLKILKCHVGDDSPLAVVCSEGSLSLDEVQLEGKRPVSAAEFLRGSPREEVSFHSVCQ